MDTTPTMTPEAAWNAMRHNLSGNTKAEMLALAFLYAAKHGWVPKGGLPGESLSTSDKEANEKLRARTVFLYLLHAQLENADETMLALDAIAAAPREWQAFSMTRDYVRRIARDPMPNSPEIGIKHAGLIARLAL